ncbi:MAG: DUF2066 domain-containing protein [Steroidobacteraceae bacterium]
MQAKLSRSVAMRNQLTKFVLLLVVLLPGWAAAVTIDDLYMATVRVADRSEIARNEAIVDALAMVLTKISGRREASTRLAMSTNASRYVQRVGYVAGGQLEVGFDSTSINALLDQSSLPLWDRERPTTLVVYPATLQGMREARDATELVAKNRGLPLVWALAETSEQFASNSLSQIQALAQRYQADAVLLARMSADDSDLSNLRWQLVFRGASQESSGGLEDGPDFAAEQISRYYAVSGKDSTTLLMEVSGVDSIKAYASTMNYLNGLLIVRGVSMQSLHGQVMRLRLELRASEESLRRVLAVDQRLSAQASALANASGMLSYRYNQ